MVADAHSLVHCESIPRTESWFHWQGRHAVRWANHKQAIRTAFQPDGVRLSQPSPSPAAMHEGVVIMTGEGDNASDSLSADRRSGRRAVGIAFIDTTRRTCLMDGKLGEGGKPRFQTRPNPARQLLTGWIFKTRDVIEIVMIELIINWLEGLLDIRKIHDPTGVGINLTPYMDIDPKRVAMQSCAFMSGGNMRQAMGCFEAK